VFGDVDVANSAEVLANWEKIKRTEKGYEDRKSILDGVLLSLPALQRAMKISKKAAGAGFEWDSIDGVFDKLAEEIAELHEARQGGSSERIESEVGDLLFTVVNIARFLKVDPEQALRQMTDRFITRFKRIETVAEGRGLQITELSQPQMEEIWQEAKQLEKA
jgi:tetrapyrrole methylase family protein/MazG family protein